MNGRRVKITGQVMPAAFLDVADSILYHLKCHHCSKCAPPFTLRTDSRSEFLAKIDPVSESPGASVDLMLMTRYGLTKRRRGLGEGLQDQEDDQTRTVPAPDFDIVSISK